MTSALALLRKSPEFGTLPEEHLAYLANSARVRAVREGQTVFEQGTRAEACFLLRTGEVAMAFHRSAEVGAATVDLRHFSGPGRLLGWSALIEPHRYRATVTALAPSTLLELPRTIFEQRIEACPDFGVALLDRVISILGNRLRETRIWLVTRRYETEVAAIRALLDQSAEVLHVDSPLHRIPHYLENRLTLGDAFHALELLRAHGDRHERDLAALALEILQQVRRDLTLYQDLQRVYETVASASPETAPAEIRRRCCEGFVTLYEKLDYVIRGEENLPDRPGHIFIMNHLFNHPDNTLPNRFQLTLDTHFVSAMLLLRKYGEAPIRVIRKSRSDEFGHQKYYDRLGYIYVASGHIDGSDGDARTTPKEWARHFLDSARAHLLAGRNLVICPEGTSVSTEDSPVAFKAGAFRLALHVEPEPLIVPVAVANFDKKITRTRLAACVHEPFRLSASVPRSASDATLFDFVNHYQQRFVRFVSEAAELAGAPEPPSPPRSMRR
jgi:CRP-like cAMP-binding protein